MFGSSERFSTVSYFGDSPKWFTIHHTAQKQPSLLDPPLGQELVLLVFLHSGPDAESEESDSRVQHDVSEEVLVHLRHHPSVVTRVDVVPPLVLHWINVQLGNAQHGHLLEVPISFNPPEPVTTRIPTQPDNRRPQPEIDGTSLVWRHDCLFHSAIHLRVDLGGLCGLS